MKANRDLLADNGFDDCRKYQTKTRRAPNHRNGQGWIPMERVPKGIKPVHACISAD